MNVSTAQSIFAAIALSASVHVQAQTLDDESVAALERFYEQFSGDDWTNREGWLEPGVAPCDWHGVDCGSWGGEFGIQALELPGNNLRGEISGTDIFDHLRHIDLSNNALSGPLTRLPRAIETLILTGNRITGPLPDALFTSEDNLYWLDLSHNRIDGSVPDTWDRLHVPYLDLSNNQLSDGWKDALLAASNYVNIADNNFSGSLDGSGVFVQHLLDHNSSSTAGGVNLCWNDFEVSSESRITAIAERHVGGADFRQCLARQRVPLDASVSGSWFDPERSGEGISMHLLQRGGVLLYHFGFDGAGRQHWLVGVGREDDSALFWPERVISTLGRFGDGTPEEAIGGGVGFGTDWRMDRTDEDRFHIERTYADFSQCPSDPPSPMPCPAQMHSDRFDYSRLSAIAGTVCGANDPMQSYSGAWYDPQRSGEGFLVEVLEDGTGLVYWFTYQPDDSMHQAWMIGTGEFNGQTLIIDDLIQPTGGTWGDDFDPTAIELEHWGSLQLEFQGPDSAHVYYDSVKDAYGSGDYALQRLTRVRMADCEQDG
ncbi:MAG: hypothetical protein U5L08_06010 [Xanthomonadales bacterium]|nr:hypothetical protein [Xanthomonadales bacterium]